MAGDVVIGKVSIKVMPDTDEFRDQVKHAIEAIEHTMQVNLDVEVSVPDAIAEAETAAEAAQKAVEKKPLKFRVNMDEQGDLESGIKRLENRLIELGRTEFELDWTNEDEIADLMSDLRNQLSDIATVDIRFNKDSIQSLDRGIAKIDAELEKLREQQIAVALDKNSLEDAKEQLLALRKSQADMQLAYDNESFKLMRERVTKALSDIEVDFDADPLEGKKLKSKIEKLFEKQEALKLQVQPDLSDREKHELQREIEEIDAEIEVSLAQFSKRVTQAELQVLARKRKVELTPVLNQAAASKVAASLAALSGGRALNNIGTDVADWIGGLDEAIPKIATATLLIGNLASVGLTSTANIASLAASLATVGQAGLALPGILGGIAVGLGATIVVMQDFNDRLPFVADRLGEIRDEMSDTFWDKAEAPFRSLANEILPLAERGLVKVSDSLGTFFSELAGAAEGQFGESLTGMFDALAESIDIASEYADSFVGIIDKLGTLGAENLPALAEWFGGIAQDFDKWLGDQGTDGLQKFVDTGIDALQDLGAITRDFFATFASIARVAESTGASTLESLRDTMAGVRETVESPGFQRALRNAFTGAREGLEAFADAAGGPFQRLLRRLARTFTEILPSIGRSGGGLLGGIFGALAQPKFQNAIIGFFDSIESAVDDIVPTLPGVADGLAGIIDVLGTLTEGIGEALGRALEFVGPAIADVAPHIERLAEELTDLINNAVEIAGPAFEDMADGLGVLADTLSDIIGPLNALLDALGKIPGVNDTLGTIVAIGATVGAATWLGAGVRNKISSLGDSLTKAGDSGYLANTKLGTLGTTLQGFASKITVGKAALGGLAIAGGVLADEAGLSNTAMFGLAGTMGGPVVAALAATAGLVLDIKSHFDQTNDTIEGFDDRIDEAMNTGNVEAMSGVVSDVTKQFTEAKDTADEWGLSTIFSAQKWADLWATLTGGETTADKFAEALHNAADAMERVTASSIDSAFEAGSFDQLKAALDAAEQAMQDAKASGDDDVFKQMSANADEAYQAVVTFRDAMAEVGLAMGSLTNNDLLSKGGLTGLLEIEDGDVDRIASAVIPALDLLNIAVDDFVAKASEGGPAGRRMIEEVAGAIDYLNSTAGKTQAITDAFAGIDDRMENTASKADRLRTALDNLFNPVANLIQANDSWHESLGTLDERLKKTEDSLFAQTEASRTNRSVLIDQAGRINDVIVAMVDQGKSAKTVRDRYAHMRETLINSISAITGNRREVTKLVDQLLKVPKEVKPKVKVDGADKAKHDVEKVKGKVKELGGEVGRLARAPEKPMREFTRGISEEMRRAETVVKRGTQNVKKTLDFKAPKPDMSALPTTIAASTATAKVQASNGGSSIGSALKQGIINGFSGTQSLLVSQAVNAVAAAIAAARARARIHSPSKETEEIGKMLGLGLAVGIETQTRNVEKAAKEVTERALRAYSKVGRDIDDVLSRIDRKASKEFKKQHKDDIKRLQRLGKEYEKALNKLKELVQKQRDFEKSVRDTIIQTGNPTTFDIITPEGIVTGMQDAIEQAEKFRKVIRKLIKEGLNKTTLQQILAAGPDAGLAVAESILAAGVDQVNNLQHQLQQTANDTGDLVGDHLFGNAIDKAEDNVERLLKKLQPTARQLRKFARDFVRALDKALDDEFNKKHGDRNNDRSVNHARLRSGDTSLTGDQKTSGKGDNITLNYYASDGPQLSAEERLFGAAKRARMVLK
jgi:phage-related protein